MATQWVMLGLGGLLHHDLRRGGQVLRCAVHHGHHGLHAGAANVLPARVTGFLFIMQRGTAYGSCACAARARRGHVHRRVSLHDPHGAADRVLWGDYGAMISNMEDWEREGNTIVTMRALRPTFSALSNLSTGYFVVGLANVALLTMTRELWSDWHELDDVGGDLDQSFFGGGGGGGGMGGGEIGGGRGRGGGGGMGEEGEELAAAAAARRRRAAAVHGGGSGEGARRPPATTSSTMGPRPTTACPTTTTTTTTPTPRKGAAAPPARPPARLQRPGRVAVAAARAGTRGRRGRKPARRNADI